MEQVPPAFGPRFCELCQSFNVRSLILESAKDGVGKYSTAWEKLSKENVLRFPWLFFKQHANLSDLRDASGICDFCCLVWQIFRGSADNSKIPDDKLNSGIGGEQIYVGCTPLDAAWHCLQQVVVFQHGDNEITRTLAWLDVYAQRGREPPDNLHLLTLSVALHSGSDECLKVAQEWLRSCINSHPTCNSHSDTKSPLPTRLIDVDALAEDGSPKPCLVVGDAQRNDFVALSYCWGGESALTLTAGTKERLEAGLSLSEFPPTLRDAIIVTRKLGVRFLWIDALCIRQDSPEEWASESAKMRDVYRGAIVTVTAASATKASEGIFRFRSQAKRECMVYWKDGSEHHHHAYLRQASELEETRLPSMAINERAWTLQESLLAPRTLWLCDKQNMFECAEGQVDEAGRALTATENYRSKEFMHQMSAHRRYTRVSRLLRALKVPAVLNMPSISGARRPQQVFTQGSLLSALNGEKLTYYDHWREIVQEYTKRIMTNPEDVFPALSGLADEFQRVTGDTYVAGMWKGDLIRSLNWRRWPSKEIRPRENLLAPSWSWASFTGKNVFFPPGINWRQGAFRMTNLAEVVSFDIESATTDKYGRLQRGELTLDAPFLAIDDPRREPHPKSHTKALQTHIKELLEDETSVLGYEFKQKHRGHPSQQFAVLHTLQWEQLGMADPISEVLILFIESTENRLYRRVGGLGVRLTVMQDNGATLRNVVQATAWKKQRITLM